MISNGRVSLTLHGRSSAAIFLLAIFLFLSGCSAPQTRDLLSQRQPNERQQQLLEVPFYPQTRYQCGPAALAGLLQYYGVDTSPQKLEPLVYLPERKGSLQLEMKAAVRRHGLIAYPLTAVEGQAMSSLLAALDEGYPVLVLQNLGIEMVPQWHYAVVTGYDLGSGEIILNSGTQPNLRLNMSRFEHTWRRSGYWALLASTPDRIPKLADPLGWNSAHRFMSVTTLRVGHSLLGQFHWPGFAHSTIGPWTRQRTPMRFGGSPSLASLNRAFSRSLLIRSLG